MPPNAFNDQLKETREIIFHKGLSECPNDRLLNFFTRPIVNQWGIDDKEPSSSPKYNKEIKLIGSWIPGG